MMGELLEGPQHSRGCQKGDKNSSWPRKAGTQRRGNWQILKPWNASQAFPWKVPRELPFLKREVRQGKRNRYLVGLTAQQLTVSTFIFMQLGRPEKLFSNAGNFTKTGTNSVSMLSKEKAWEGYVCGWWISFPSGEEWLDHHWKPERRLGQLTVSWWFRGQALSGWS